MPLTFLHINMGLASHSFSLPEPPMKISTMLHHYSTSITHTDPKNPFSASPIRTTKKLVESLYPGFTWACNSLPFAGMSRTSGLTPLITVIAVRQRLGTSFLRAIRRNLMLTCSKRPAKESF